MLPLRSNLSFLLYFLSHTLPVLSKFTPADVVIHLATPSVDDMEGSVSSACLEAILWRHRVSACDNAQTVIPRLF